LAGKDSNAVIVMRLGCSTLGVLDNVHGTFIGAPVLNVTLVAVEELVESAVRLRDLNLTETNVVGLLGTAKCKFNGSTVLAGLNPTLWPKVE